MTTTLNPDLPTKTVTVVTQTVIDSEVEVEVPDVDAYLDEAFSHLARHLGEQAGVIDLALEMTHPLDVTSRAALQGYLEALEDVSALMGAVRDCH